jgi:chromosomal replication initiation ATPase DnaA
MEKAHEKVWRDCLSFIEDNLSASSFTTWFEPIIPVKLKNKVLTIQVPSQFFYEWLEEHYIELLKKAIQKEFGSFDQYVWSFSGGKTIVNHYKSLSEIPAKTPVSDAMSLDMGKHGFKFRGSTICYAFMQAVGIVNDHMDDCWRK